MSNNVLLFVRQKAIAACFSLILIAPAFATAQEIIPLYPNSIPNSKVSDVDNSIRYFEALRHHNVPAEMHIFPKGGHGFVFGQKKLDGSLVQLDEKFKLNESAVTFKVEII